MGTVSVSMGDETGRIEFHISPGPAQKALLQFGSQSNLNIFFVPDDVRGARVNGIQGFMEPRGALERLLEGTSLCPTYTPAGKSVTVGRCSKAQEDANVPLSTARDAGAPPTIQAAIQTVPVTATATHIHGVTPISVGLMTISRDDFDAYGIRTAADLFARVPMLADSSPLGPRLEGNSGLGAAVGLRGQSAGATRILVNDHPLAGSGARGAFQDGSNIPMSAIDRVDIVPDGASAQYGSDAVGGVINLRTLSGAQQPRTSAQLSRGIGGLQQAILSQVIGKDWSTGSAIATVEFIGASPWEGPNLVVPQKSGSIDRVPGKELVSGYLRVEQRVPFRSELTAEGIYTHRREALQYDTALPTLLNASVREKTAAAAQMTYFAAESRTAVTDDGVFVASVSRATETGRQRTYPTGPVEFAGGMMEDPSLVPVYPILFSTFSRTEQLSVKYDDTLWTYGAGKVKGVVGGEYRRETFNPTDKTAPMESVTRYGRHVRAVFGELSLPLIGDEWAQPGIRKLELSVAGRREWYSDFMGRFTPQFQLLWIPLDGLELRGSVGRSSQAPNLPSLDTSRNVVLLTPLADSQSSTGQSDALVQAGNNSHLRGETATTLSLGVRFHWTSSEKSFMGAELNSFRMHFYDRIQAADPSQIGLSDPSYAPLVERNFSDAERQQLCRSKQFVGKLDSCLTDSIAAIVDLTLKNIDSLSTQGLDVRGNWGAKFGALRAGITLQGIYFYQFDEKITPAAPAAPLLRTEKSPTALQVSGLFSITYGVAQLGFLVQYSSGFRDESATPAREIPGWTTMDLQASYTLPETSTGLLRNVTISVAARNLADRPLPVLADSSVNQSYDFLSGFAVRRLISVALQKRL